MRNNNAAPKTISEAIKNNPFSAITTFIAITGVVVSLFNLYFLSQFVPLNTRVNAVETRIEKIDPLLTEFIEVKTEFKGLKDNVADIKTDVKEIKKGLKIY